MDNENNKKSVSERIFPADFPPPTKYMENEVMSNLPLQMALYFNVLLFPFWCCVLIYFLILKHSTYSELYQFITVTVLVAVISIEILRLFMGYEGNLKDKIPELAGFWMLSFLLQFPLQGFLLFNPYFNLHVIETVCQSIIFIMLIIQIIFGYVALRNTTKKQAAYYNIVKQLTTK